MPSGIYGIFSKVSRSVYIGKSNNIQERFWSHIGTLRSGIHRNEPLQKEWSEHGESAFEFRVICELEENRLLDAEREIAEKYKSDGFRLFNLRGCGSGCEVAKETRKKISASLLGKRKTKEHAARIAASQKGRKYSDESRKRMSDSHKGKKHSAELIAKRVAAITGQTRSPEWKKEHSERMTAIFAKRRALRAEMSNA